MPSRLITNVGPNIPTAHKKFAHGRSQRARGAMNKTEAAYAIHLEALKCAGEILWYLFEGVTLKLAFDTRYSPDFIVMTKDGLLECHEVKGFWEDDAKVKIKVASSMFPFRFVAIQAIAKRDGGGWRETKF